MTLRKLNMLNKLKEYFKKTNQRSTVQQILNGYDSAKGCDDITELYESKIRLALLKEDSYLFEKKVESITGKKTTEEYPHEIDQFRTMFSQYRDKKNKNFLHLLLESNISNRNLKTWLKLLPGDMLFEKDYNDLSPLIYSISKKRGIFSLLKEIDIKLPYLQRKETFSHLPLSTKKGLEHIRFAIIQDDSQTVVDFYEKNPKALNIYLKKNHLTPLSLAISCCHTDLVKYFISKGCRLNQNTDIDTVDDVITIVEFGENLCVENQPIEKNILHMYLKYIVLPEQKEYEFKNNIDSMARLFHFNDKQLEITFDLIPELTDKKNIHLLMDYATVIDKTPFIHYIVNNYKENYDEKEVIEQMVFRAQRNHCLIDKITTFIDLNNNPVLFKEILEESRIGGNTLLHDLSKSGIIDPNIVHWFKKNNFNLFICNDDNHSPFDFLSEQSKSVAQQIYIEEYIQKEKDILNNTIIVSSPRLANKSRI